MRIETTPKLTPRQGPPSSRPTTGASPSAPLDEQERFVWEKLAPRLLHPSKLAFIQALLRHGLSLTLTELAEAAGITREHARHQCKAMQRAGVLEVVSVGGRPDGKDDEPSYFFPKPSQTEPSTPPSTTV